MSKKFDVVAITGKYTDKDGNKRQAQEIRVNDVALQGGKREGAAPAQRQAPATAPRATGGDAPRLSRLPRLPKPERRKAHSVQPAES